MNVKNMKPYANLHLHSTHSDGVYSPAELVAIAKAEGYRALAITDHDTASAYTELKAECEKEGMECLFGAEFSVIEPYDFHIVGFGFDPEYPEMKEYLEKMAMRQTDNTKKCFDNAVSLGNITGITWDEVLKYNTGIPWLCNNHVFRAMKAKGMGTEEYSDYLDLRKYGTVPHSGFGLGFERVIMYCTGMANIRDVIFYPRTVGNIR